MNETINKLDRLLQTGKAYISNSRLAEFELQASPEKWSKKQILGHLVDSGINNLRRFTEIQFKDKPYKIIPYNQDELVKANDYQGSDIEEILSFWLAINERIKVIMKQQTEKSLNYKIVLYEDKFSDLKFLMEDYVDHLEHHLNQIIK